VANLVVIKYAQIMGNLGAGASALSGEEAINFQVSLALGNGFILTAMLWGAFGAHLIDRSQLKASAFLFICALFTLFGVIHSVMPEGRLYLPWLIEGSLHWRIAIGYAAFALMLLVMFSFDKSKRAGPGEQ
jgi:AGZA family xanthine/uracil permease-like MFS transporter